MSALTHSAVAPRLQEPVSTYRRTTPTLLQSIGRAVWRSLEAVGQRRAARELDRLARYWAPFDADLARDLRTAARFDTLN